MGGQSKAGLSHQALFVAAGVTQTAIGTGIWTAGNVTASGFIGNASSATDLSRSVIAGTGLTGGGKLNANRTLSVDFGSTATTVAKGNHTHSYVPLSGNVSINISGANFVVKNIPQTSTGSHLDKVILLIPICETNSSWENRIEGEIIIGKNGGNIYNTINISAQSN